MSIGDIYEWSKKDFQEYIEKAGKEMKLSTRSLWNLFYSTDCNIPLFILAVQDIKEGCDYSTVFITYSREIKIH